MTKIDASSRTVGRRLSPSNLSPIRNSLKTFLVAILLVVAVVGLPLSLLHHRGSNNNDGVLRKEASQAAMSSSTMKQNGSVPPLSPIGTVIGSTEVFYMAPDSEANPRGVLVFFHGCHHGGQDAFLLPEDRLLVQESLQRGLVVISPTSTNRKSGCWSTPTDLDNLITDDIVDHILIERLGLSSTGASKLPRMGMGVSSGANFLFKSYKGFQFKSVASYVGSIGYKESELKDSLSTTSDKQASSSLPPAVFVHMADDKKRTKDVLKAEDRLKQYGVPVGRYEIKPKKFTSKTCNERLPEVGSEGCTRLFELLNAEKKVMKNNFIQESGPYQDLLDKFVEDDRGSEAGTTTRGELPPVSFSGKSWTWAAVEEEFKVSIAHHETTAEHRTDVLDFLMKHAGLGDKKTKRNTTTSANTKKKKKNRRMK